ncbi:MAG: glycosyltransferase family 4 protein [Prolixibacteraceae bacterium]
MKILFLSNKVPYPPKDGGSIASFGLMKAFADTGHQVSVLAMNTNKHYVNTSEIPDEIKAAISFHMLDVPAYIKTFDLLKNLFFSKLPYNAERFIDRNYQVKLQQILTSESFDIIQLEGLYLCPYIATIRKYSSAKIAYRAHNIEYEIWQRTILQSQGIRKIYLKILTHRLKKFEASAINQYDFLIPITNRDRDILNQMGNTKPTLTISAGFDTEEVRSVYSNFSMNLFFIGALDWSPNQEGLIWFIEKCWPLILKAQPTTQLKIAGRNAPEWMEDKFKVKNVTYLGEIENAQKFISQNGIMIAPVLSGSGMRVKIIEGMLHQKTIVTTSIGCEGINVKNEEHLFIADNYSDFSNYIIALLANRPKVIETGIKAFNFVKEEYDNRYLIKKLAAFYKQFTL